MKRRWIFWILVIVFLWVVISRFSQIKNLYESMLQGQWQWVVVAIGLQFIYFTTFSGLYQSSFQIVGVESKLFELIPVTFSALFMNLAIPIGSASGFSLFVDDASRRGQSAARATIGTLLVMISDLSAFMMVLVVGMIFLFTRHDLKIYESFTASILLLLIVSLISFLFLGLWRPLWLARLMSVGKNIANRIAHLFRRPDFLDESWVERNTNEFTEAATAVANQPLLLARNIAIGFAAHLANLATLYVLFLAFHQPVELGVLVAGYAMGILFLIIAITPQGIGVVEGIMTLVFASLGVPIDKATIIALTYRGLTFWLPMFIGFLLLRRTRTFRT
jgi:glycosyltransferase 2 family protein